VQDSCDRDEDLGVEATLKAAALLVVACAVGEVGLDQGEEAVFDFLGGAQRPLDEREQTCSEVEG
jgi:hypothetical protein